MDITYMNEYKDALQGSKLDLLALPFGVRHKLLRGLLEVTIDNIAEATGIHPYTITRWEKHGGVPYSGTREKLVDFWGVLGVPQELVESR